MDVREDFELWLNEYLEESEDKKDGGTSGKGQPTRSYRFD